MCRSARGPSICSMQCAIGEDRAYFLVGVRGGGSFFLSSFNHLGNIDKQHIYKKVIKCCFVKKWNNFSTHTKFEYRNNFILQDKLRRVRFGDVNLFGNCGLFHQRRNGEKEILNVPLSAYLAGPTCMFHHLY